MYTTLKIISRKFLGVSLIWTFFSHVGAIFYETSLISCAFHVTIVFAVLTLHRDACNKMCKPLSVVRFM